MGGLFAKSQAENIATEMVQATTNLAQAATGVVTPTIILTEAATTQPPTKAIVFYFISINNSLGYSK